MHNKVLVRISEGKRPLGRPSNRSKGNIIKHLKEPGCDVVNCIHLTEDQDHCWNLVNTVMNNDIP
jgi:hypothetical protein